MRSANAARVVERPFRGLVNSSHRLFSSSIVSLADEGK